MSQSPQAVAPTSSRNVAHNEPDLAQVTRVLFRGWWIIGLSVMVSSSLVYLYSNSLPPTYQSVGSVIAVRGETGNNIINSTLVTAPPLPAGAVDEALHTRVVVDSMIRRVEGSNLTPTLKRQVIADLQNELRQNIYRRITVEAKIDQQQTGVYKITASAETPEAASILSGAAVQALLEWDVQRATERLMKSKGSLEKQLSALDLTLARSDRNSLERQTAFTARANVLQSLAQVAVLENASTGTLTLMSPGEVPVQPSSPRPVRDALLTGALMLLLSGGALLTLDALRRRVMSEEDLVGFGLPVVGKLPRIMSKDLKKGMVEATRSGALYEASGFLRVNLMSVLETSREKTLIVSSARSGEGKSSVSASLAEAFGTAGQKVLLIDMDLHRPTQHKLWASRMQRTRPLPGSTDLNDKRTNIQDALRNPEGAFVFQVSENVDLLPAGPAQRSASHVTNHLKLHDLLDRWSSQYDLVILDTPPILALSDALTLTRNAAGILMVVEAHGTMVHNVETAIRSTRTANSRVLGFVLNKGTEREDQYYYYHNYRPEKT